MKSYFFPMFKNNLCINWSVLHSGKNASCCIFNKIPANFHNIALLQAAQKCNSVYATFKKHQYQVKQMNKYIIMSSDLSLVKMNIMFSYLKACVFPNV